VQLNFLSELDEFWPGCPSFLKLITIMLLVCLPQLYGCELCMYLFQLFRRSAAALPGMDSRDKPESGEGSF